MKSEPCPVHYWFSCRTASCFHNPLNIGWRFLEGGGGGMGRLRRGRGTIWIPSLPLVCPSPRVSNRNFNQRHLALSWQTSALCISGGERALSMSGCASVRPLSSMTSTPLSASHLPLWQAPAGNSDSGWPAAAHPMHTDTGRLDAINGMSQRQCHGNIFVWILSCKWSNHNRIQP